jgi:ComF family protein
VDLLGLFFPKKCISCKKFGAYLCPNCFARLDFDVALICGVCGRQAVSGLTHPTCRGRYTIDGIFASLVYKGITKELIYQFKFAPYLSDLSHELVELFYEGLIQQEMFMKILTNDALFVPIPLHAIRERSRGYNQANILAKKLATKFGVNMQQILSRIQKTSTQVGKTQKERRDNIKGVFSLNSQSNLKNKTIFLIDDVVTSGSTMNEAAGVLKGAGAKAVYGLGLAHGL